MSSASKVQLAAVLFLVVLATAAGGLFYTLTPDYVSKKAMAAYDRNDYETALKLWLSMADRADNATLSRMGFLYNNGWGGEQSFTEAAKWYQKAADRGYVGAQFNLGLIYSSDLEGAPQDNVQAYKWFSLAAKGGNDIAQEKLAVLATAMTPEQIAEAESLAAAWQPGQDAAPKEETKTAAATPVEGNKPTETAVDAPASPKIDIKIVRTPIASEINQQALDAYERKDYETAMEHWLSIAEQITDPEAQHSIGIMYDRGWGTTQNHPEAVKWYQKAAEHGIPIAYSYSLLNLGLIYAEGREGVPQDNVQAYKWFSLAAKAENTEAAKAIEDIAAKMTPEQVAEAQSLAASWEEKHTPSAEQVDTANALAAAKMLYNQGAYGEALRLWQSVPPERLDPEMQYKIARMPRPGEVNSNLTMVTWLRKAAERGHVGAQLNLGLQYTGGVTDIPEDNVQAYKWFSLAASAGNSLALKKIGDIVVKMTPEQIAEAESLAASWTPTEEVPATAPEMQETPFPPMPATPVPGTPRRAEN